jgi:hypothetical protein
MRKSSNVSKNLLRLVEAMPHIKGDYNAIVMHYWSLFDNEFISNGKVSFNDVSKLTPVETISRYYRRLVASGLVATNKTIAKEVKKTTKSDLCHMV